MQHTQEELAKAAREIEDSFLDEWTGPSPALAKAPSPTLTHNQIKERLEKAAVRGDIPSSLLSIADRDPAAAVRALPREVAERYGLPSLLERTHAFTVADVKERLERAVNNGHLDSRVLSLADASLHKALGSIPEDVARKYGLPIVEGGRPVEVWIPQTGR